MTLGTKIWQRLTRRELLTDIQGDEKGAGWYDVAYSEPNSVYHVHYTQSPYYFMWTVMVDRIPLSARILEIGCGIMEVARAHGLAVVEDCAQAIGATYKGRKVGSFGDAGCLSFFPSKNLGCFGDGGMVITNNADLAERVEMLRRHGGRVKYHHSELGLNSRLDELQAAILRVKLPHLEGWNEGRREIAAGYTQRLADVAGVVLPHELGSLDDRSLSKVVRCVYHQYTVRVPNRELLQMHLTEAGIATMVYYPVPLHLQEVHAALGYGAGSFPIAERAALECLSLPIFPELAETAQEAVVDALATAVQGEVFGGAAESRL